MDFRYLEAGQLANDERSLGILKSIGEGDIRLPDHNLAALVKKSVLGNLTTLAEQKSSAGTLKDRDFVLIQTGIKIVINELDKQYLPPKKTKMTSDMETEIRVSKDPSFLNPIFTKAEFLIRAGHNPKGAPPEMSLAEIKEAIQHMQLLFRIGIVSENDAKAFINGVVRLVESESEKEWKEFKKKYTKDDLNTLIISRPPESYNGVLRALGDYIDLDVVAPEAKATLQEAFSALDKANPEAAKKIASSINKLIFKCYLLRKYASIEEPERRKSALSTEINQILSSILDTIPDEVETARAVNSFLYFLRDQAFATNSQRPLEELIKQYAETGETSRAVTIGEHASVIIKHLHNKNLKTFLEEEGAGATLRFEGISTLWEKYRLVQDVAKKGLYYMTMLTLIDEKSVKRTQVPLDLSPFLVGCDDIEINKRLPYLFKAIHVPSKLLESIQEGQPVAGLEALSNEEILALHHLGEAFINSVEIEMSRVVQRPRKN